MTQPAASEIGVGAVLRETYELTSLLGKGGMGAVFLARHRRLPGRHVAVKVLHPSMGQNPELYARFRREAEIASQLGHPNIVEVLDFDTLPDGTPFLVMECLRGESLEERLARGRLPLEQALAITRQIGSALQAAHRAGVVHRDLKPANVFLVPSESEGGGGERVKLLDFGISKMLDSQTLRTQDAVLMGTPQYMAPEQALGKNSEVDARTDLFTLGCIVYEMLSGAPPFAGDGGSIVQVIFRIVHTQPEPLAKLCPELPARVVAAVERALAKSQQDRYPDIVSFVTELTGSPLQTLSGAGPVSRAAPMSAELGFDATLVPSSTARLPAAADEVGFDATLVPVAKPPARASSRVAVAAGVGVLLLGGAASGWWLASRPAPVPASSAPVTVVVPAPEVPKVFPSIEPLAAPAPAPAVAAPTLSEGKPPEPQPVRQRAPEVLPEEVRRDLEEAERALAADEPELAIRLARRSQQTRITPASYSLLTRAHCRQKDLSNARAQWRKVSSAERRVVRQFCEKYEIDL